MPIHSEKQRRYLYVAAAAGHPWAKRYLRHSGFTPPPRRRSAPRRQR